MRQVTFCVEQSGTGYHITIRTPDGIPVGRPWSELAHKIDDLTGGKAERWLVPPKAFSLRLRNWWRRCFGQYELNDVQILGVSDRQALNNLIGCFSSLV